MFPEAINEGVPQSRGNWFEYSKWSICSYWRLDKWRIHKYYIDPFKNSEATWLLGSLFFFFPWRQSSLPPPKRAVVLKSEIPIRGGNLSLPTPLPPPQKNTIDILPGNGFRWFNTYFHALYSLFWSSICLDLSETSKIFKILSLVYPNLREHSSPLSSEKGAGTQSASIIYFSLPLW